MLKIQSLSCRRGGRKIFRDVSLDLRAGDTLLVTGANGSGKSTLLRMLAGLLPPLSGSIFWQGQNIEEDPDTYRQSLRYVGHLDTVKPELTVAEMLDYWRALQGVDSNTAPLSQDPFGLSPLLDKPVRTLSAGQKRRLALTRLIFSKASLWLLDEPLTALDQVGQDILIDCIAKHSADGGISLIATHHDMTLSGATRYRINEGRA